MTGMKDFKSLLNNLKEYILILSAFASLAINTNWKAKWQKEQASKGHDSLSWGGQICKESYVYDCKSVN